MGMFNVFKKKENDYKEVKQKLNKIFAHGPIFTNFGDESGLGDIVGLYPENVFEKAHLGYRVDSKGYKNKKWIGDKFFIIGDYNGLGDPLIVDVSKEKLPIYAIRHDKWDDLEEVAYSFDDFSEIINLINNTNVKNTEECLFLKEKISKIIKTDFWNNQIDIVNKS